MKVQCIMRNKRNFDRIKMELYLIGERLFYGFIR